MIPISSSGSTVCFVGGVLVGDVLAIGVDNWLDRLPVGRERSVPERRGFFTGEGKVETVSVTSSERHPEGISKYVKVELRSKIIFPAQPMMNTRLITAEETGLKVMCQFSLSLFAISNVVVNEIEAQAGGG